MNRSIIILFLLSTLHLSAQWVSDPNLNTMVADDSQFEETIPMATPGPNGSTYFSWFQSNGSGSYFALMQLLNQQGVAVWPVPLVVSSHPQSSALYKSDMASDSAGNALWAFQDIRNGNTETVIYKIDASGSFLWGLDGIPLHDVNATFEASPRIAVFEDNDVVVAWNASSGADKWIAWHLIESNGTLVFSTPAIITSSTANFSRAVPLVTSLTDFIMVYVEETGSFPGLTSKIFARSYDLNGNDLWPNPLAVSNYTIGFVSQPLVAHDLAGGCFVAYTSGTPGSPAINDGFLQYISSAGFLNFGNDGLELSNLSGNHKFVSDIFFNGNDAQLYALLKVTDNGQGSSGVYVQATDISGNQPYGSAGVELAPVSSSAYAEPFLIENAWDGVMAVWTEGGFNNQHIKAHKIDYSGNPVFPVPVTLSSISSGKSRLTGNSLTDGTQLVISWEDTRNGQGVYAQNIFTDGTTGLITTWKNEVVPDKVFPSLITGTLRCTSPDIARIVVFDYAGRKIIELNTKNGHSDIDLSFLNDGMYFYQFTGKSTSGSGKFLLVKP